MRRTLLIRLGGLAAMVGGALWASLALPWPFYLETVFFLFLVLGALAPIVAIVAIATLLVAEGERWRMLVAPLTAFVGVVLSLVGLLAKQQGLPVADLLLFVGLLVGSLGLFASAMQVIIFGALPWWGGAALIAGSPPLAAFLYLLEPSLLGAPWAVVGYAILRAATRQAQQPPRVR